MGDDYVALDMLPNSFTYPNTMFWFRYRFMQAVVSYVRSAGYKHFDCNEHFPMRTTEDIARFMTSSGFKDLKHDGIVLVPHSGVTHQGYVPTRYLKRVKTVDVAGADGRIEERYVVDGKIGGLYRHRPDKIEPNHTTAIKDLLVAPDYRDTLQQLASQFDIKLDLLEYDALNLKGCYIPTERIIPDDTWIKLYVGRSAVPEQYSARVAHWMRVRGQAMKARVEAEIQRLNDEPKPDNGIDDFEISGPEPDNGIDEFEI